jgi:hypothetical protein
VQVVDELVVLSDQADREHVVSETAKIAPLIMSRVREGLDIENTLIGECVRIGAPYDVRHQLVKVFQAEAPDLLTPAVEDVLLAPVSVR